MAKSVIHERPWPVTNEKLGGFEMGHKITQKGQQFICVDWFPWINRFGAPAVVFVWITHCKCGQTVRATSGSRVSRERMPTPRNCEACNEAYP